MSDRIDELGERARWFLEQFDGIDLAAICAAEETAKLEAQAAIGRVRKATANSFMAGPNGVDVVRVADVLAALDTVVDILADKNGPTIANAQVGGGEVVDNEADTTPACWLCLDKGGLAVHNNASEQFGRPLWTAHKPFSRSHPVTPCPACRAADEPAPDNSPAATDPTRLRQEYATAVDAVFEQWRDGLGDRRPEDVLTDAVLAVRDREIQHFRAWLAGEYDKADAADRAADVPPELMIRPHNGIAAGIAIALHAVDCMLGTQPEEQP